MRTLPLLLVLLFAPLVDAAPKFVANGVPSRDSIINGKRDWPNKITATDVDPKAGLLWRYDAKKLGVVSISEYEKYFVGPPGVYQIEVLSILLDGKGKTTVDSATITLQIAPAVDDPVVPPKPVDPVVPVPPKPVDPVVPVPTDDLTKSIQDAYSQDTDPDKARLKGSLASAFLAITDDKVLSKAKSAAAIYDGIGAYLAVDGVTGKIPKTQDAVKAYLNDKVPPVDRILTESRRSTIKIEFGKVAAALKAVK